MLAKKNRQVQADKNKENDNPRSKSPENEPHSQHDVPFDPNNNCKNNGDTASTADKNDQQKAAAKTSKINDLLSMLDAMRLEKSKSANVVQNVNGSNTNAAPNVNGSNTNATQNVNATFTVSANGDIATNAKPAAKSDTDIKTSHEYPKNIAPAKAPVPAPKVIPNVFDDDIFDFITQSGTKRANGFSRNEKASLEPNRPALRQQSTVSWRERPNERTEQIQPIPQWRLKDNGADSVTKVAATNSSHAAVPKPAINSNVTPAQATHTEAPLGASSGQASAVNQASKPIPTTQTTQRFIHNGALVTGVGIKPCPAYALNSLYEKFPHLNKDKVPNPLKPVTVDQSRRPNNTDNRPHQNSGPLQDFFDKLNKEKKSQGAPPNANRLNQMKELTSSLTSLPAFYTNGQNNSAAHRMPGRSVSSINLPGISRISGSNPQKGGQKQQQNANGQNRNNERPKQDNRQQSNDQNRAKGKK